MGHPQAAVTVTTGSSVCLSEIYFIYTCNGSCDKQDKISDGRQQTPQNIPYFNRKYNTH